MSSRSKITDEEIMRLVVGAKDGNQVIKETLVKNYERDVEVIAHSYINFDSLTIYDMEDLISDGKLGLFEAIEHYNLKSNLPFGTYATFWIFAAIYFKNLEPKIYRKLVNGKINADKQVKKITIAEKVFMDENNRQPKKDELVSILARYYKLDEKVERPTKKEEINEKQYIRV